MNDGKIQVTSSIEQTNGTTDCNNCGFTVSGNGTSSTASYTTSGTTYSGNATVTVSSGGTLSSGSVKKKSFSNYRADGPDNSILTADDSNINIQSTSGDTAEVDIHMTGTNSNLNSQA